MIRKILVVTFFLFTHAFAAAPTTVPSIVRKPQWPLKDRRTLFSEEEIARARENIARYPSAKAIAAAIVKDADEWVQWDDRKLVELIPDASVPRAFDVSAVGCPVCGRLLHEKYGNPGWLVDPKMPFKVTCRVCGGVFPTNDFETYYRSGYKTKIGWDTKYVDDGWGWTDPKTGQKFWFVAHANHWLLFGKVNLITQALARAYLLSGDARYAHKALVLLQRFAEVYPPMDLATQSRYGTMMAALGQNYPGKIVNHIWETDLISQLAEAYDACWDAIDRDTQLQQETGKTGQQLRAFIEANLLEDAIDAYYQGKIRGNYGMHQGTLARLAIVRQYGEQDKWLDSLLDDAGSDFTHLGLNYALYDLIFRDGIPFETAVHYNSIWLERISQYAPLLEKTGRKPFENPKMKRLYDGALAMICARGQNPNIGDGGTVWGGIIRPDIPSYQTGYRHYHDAKLGEYLAAYDAVGPNSFKTWDSLLQGPIDVPPATSKSPTTLPAQPTRLLDGYGMGFLNNQACSIELALYYGLRASHAHLDRLNIELFANGHPMVPDLGYPDGANEFVSGIFTWSKHTISHNTVTVDAKAQHGNVPGTVELFADGKFARVMDFSAPGTYPQCDTYRRAVFMIDCGPEQSYFVDFFTVSGGNEHDYSLHGPPGTFEVIGGTWSDQHSGTLAGATVNVGEIYDDPVLGAPGYKGGYSGYDGSGFQHFYNVRRLQGGEFVAQWSHERDPDSKLRIRTLDQDGQQIILANARVSPIKFPQVLTYLIARRQGQSLSSRFVSVIEPFKGNSPSIKQVRKIEHGVEVQLEDGRTDRITYDPSLAASVIRQGASGQIIGRFELGRTGGMTGEVLSVDPPKSQIVVRCSQADGFVGRVVHFRNELRRTAHPIVAASRQGENLVLTTGDDLLVGRARVDRIEDEAVTTKTSLFLAPIYRGVTLTNRAFEPLARVCEVKDGVITLAAPLPPNRPSPGEDVWLINVGPGDTFELPALVDESR